MACSRGFAGWIGLLALASTLRGSALAEETQAIDLNLTPESTYTTGCVDPCFCPAQIFPVVGGTLTFRLSESNVLFTIYDVEADLTVPADPPLSLKGAGIYKVGGEFAIIQEMTLDLSTNGGPAERFESGPVPIGGDFPQALAITVAVQQGVCFATAVAISARGSVPPSAPFVRGDCNADVAVDISDALRGLFFLFAGAEEPSCADACDWTDDGVFDISDAIATLNSLFLGAGPPPAPAGACGDDPTADGLACSRFPPCGEH